MQGGFAPLIVEPVEGFLIFPGIDLLIHDVFASARRHQQKNMVGHGTQGFGQFQNAGNLTQVGFGNCGVDLGLPAWFKIDQWLPWLYRVETSCGYTPFIAFKITMAETLMVLSVLVFIASVSILIASFLKIFSR